MLTVRSGSRSEMAMNFITTTVNPNVVRLICDDFINVHIPLIYPLFVPVDAWINISGGDTSILALGQTTGQINKPLILAARFYKPNSQTAKLPGIQSEILLADPGQIPTVNL